MRWGEWGAGLTTAQVRSLIEGCLQLGVNTFDHADIYGDYSEEAAFGLVLAKAPALRQNLQIVTKCGIRMLGARRPEHRLKSYDSSGAHIIASAEASLRALRTDYLDVLLLHRPDFLMDADEVATAFHLLRDSGKVRAFGVSNFTVEQVALLHSRWPDLLTNQIELSLLHLDALSDGSLDQAQRLRQQPMIWSPLAGGKLFSTNSPTPRQPALAVALEAVAERHATQADVIAYAWVLALPSRPCVVTGSAQLARIAAAQAATQVQLTREDWYELLAAARGHEVA